MNSQLTRSSKQRSRSTVGLTFRPVFLPAAMTGSSRSSFNDVWRKIVLGWRWKNFPAATYSHSASRRRWSRGSFAIFRDPTLGLRGDFVGLSLPGFASGFVLRGRRVHVHVVLAGKLHDRVHDLIGDRTQNEAVVAHALIAGEIQRLAELYRRTHDLGNDLAGRSD